MLFTILLCILLSSPLICQTEIWNGLSFEHEVTETYGYDIVLEYRRAADDFRDGQYVITGATNYALGKGFDIAPAARLYVNRGDFNEFRLMTDLNYSRELVGPFTFESRLRVQHDRPLGADGTLRQTALRPRGTLIAKVLDNVSLFTEYEARYRFDTRNEWSRNRYTSGVEWRLSSRVAVDAYFRIEDDINEGPRERTHIFGIYALYVLPDPREREWDYRRPFGRSFLW